MITPADHARLLSLTALPVLTPDDAKFIHKCMPANSWPEKHQIHWWYPIGDTGYAVPDGVRYVHPIRKPQTSRPLNPNSTEQQQPWLQAGVSRATWYQRQAAEPHLLAILGALPQEADKEEGLKLYRALARFSFHHMIDINRLWVRVCECIKGYQ